MYSDPDGERKSTTVAVDFSLWSRSRIDRKITKFIARLSDRPHRSEHRATGRSCWARKNSSQKREKKYRRWTRKGRDIGRNIISLPFPLLLFLPSKQRLISSPERDYGRMSRRTERNSALFPSCLTSLLLMLATTSWKTARAHVALTFPPARQYDLDFLDNARTPPPCGMPRGECIYDDYYYY